MTPPVSSGAYHVRPHSSRSKSASAVKAALSLPYGSVMTPRNSKIERDRPCDVANREVAHNLAARSVDLDFGTDEAKLLVVIDTQEVGGPEVVVAVLGSGTDAASLDRKLCARIARVVADGDRTGELAELASHLGDYQVSSHRTDAGMCWVDYPSAGSRRVTPSTSRVVINVSLLRFRTQQPTTRIKDGDSRYSIDWLVAKRSHGSGFPSSKGISGASSTGWTISQRRLPRLAPTAHNGCDFRWSSQHICAS